MSYNFTQSEYFSDIFDDIRNLQSQNSTNILMQNMSIYLNIFYSAFQILIFSALLIKLKFRVDKSGIVILSFFWIVSLMRNSSNIFV